MTVKLYFIFMKEIIFTSLFCGHAVFSHVAATFRERELREKGKFKYHNLLCTGAVVR